MLALENISKNFGGNRVLNDVTLTLDPNIPVTGLVGPNGSGKSTLFHVLMGFYTQDTGTIRFEGRSIETLPTHLRCRRGLSCTFQDSRMLAFMTVRENLLAVAPHPGEGLLTTFFRPGLTRTRETALKHKTDEILELLKLAPLAAQPAGSLSYGQRKLLELGRVLMNDPRLVLLDEPTAGVNPTLIRSIVEVISGLARQGIRFFLVEHNMPLVAELCERVLVLDAGELIFDGTPQQAQRDTRVIQAYLGSDADALAC